MSLNQIYDQPSDTSVKSWQNYRFNNLNILNSFNIPTGSATVGQVLRLGPAPNYDPTWVNYNTALVEPSQYADGTTSVSSILATKTELTVNNFTGSSNFTLTGGRITCNVPYCPVIFYTSITSTPTIANFPIFWIVKVKGNAETLLGVTTPYRGNTSTNVFTSCSFSAPVILEQNEQIVVYGQTIQNNMSPVALTSTETVFSVFRIA